MMRAALLWASTNPFLAERLPKYSFVRRATKRFLPGELLDDALAQAERLSGVGIATTITLLGENLDSESEADEVVEDYRTALETIGDRGLDTEISVKPTQLGLDFGANETERRLLSLVQATSSMVWLDMEGSTYVDATLDMFRNVRAAHENIGLCLQAYLHRTAEDLEALLPLDPAIRLVKGAYMEPADVALERKTDVDRSFVQLTGLLLRARASGGQARVVVGTHDPRMIAEASRLTYELGLNKSSCEYAMLYGIQRAEQDRLTRSGHQVRVLIAYGPAWFPWYMRRLAERPANVWFVLKQIVS